MLNNRKKEKRDLSQKRFRRYELQIIRRYYNLLEGQPMRKSTKSKISVVKEIKVVRHLTKFKSPPGEIELVESIRLPRAPEPYASETNLIYILDPDKNKEPLETLGYHCSITIYDGDTTVKHAFSQKFNCQVAIKTIPRPDRNLELKKVRCEFMANDLKTIINLHHKNVLKIYESFLLEDEIHIAMEYATSGTLTELIRNLKLIPEFVTQEMFRGLCRGLQFCHEKKICHRNITSDNIYVSDHMRLKLANFRMVKRCYDKMRDPFGTLMFTAPEVRYHQHSLGFQDDMWSMGMVLYVMLFGEYPYTIRRYKELDNWRGLYRISPPRNVKITPDARSVISSLLCPCKRRLTSEQLLNHRWLEIVLCTKGRYGLKIKVDDEKEKEPDFEDRQPDPNIVITIENKILTLTNYKPQEPRVRERIPPFCRPKYRRFKKH
ncbi:testis-specific serine/threonine-protein kinase 3 [Halyomorpha halys]|uniref:testis-specific serine/threonine-protein kinase 3 n=1 Tax=Halyomorpha halys TaxID=286706 RepID=UPI0006D51CD4|nr:testis-specific serine/threonine-protein kinase 2-like [Halyomorpha halys]